MAVSMYPGLTSAIAGGTTSSAGGWGVSGGILLLAAVLSAGFIVHKVIAPMIGGTVHLLERFVKVEIKVAVGLLAVAALLTFIAVNSIISAF